MRKDIPAYAFNYDLKDVVGLLTGAGSTKLHSARNVNSTFLDTFLFSGKFNTVLGPDGFQSFKNKLRSAIQKVNSDDFGANNSAGHEKNPCSWP